MASPGRGGHHPKSANGYDAFVQTSIGAKQPELRAGRRLDSGGPPILDKAGCQGRTQSLYLQKFGGDELQILLLMRSAQCAGAGSRRSR